MAFNTAKLKTKAECDQALTLASERKYKLDHDLTNVNYDVTNKSKVASRTNASLASVKAQMTGAEAGMAVMEDGPEKTEEQNKLRKLNDRKENLEEVLTKGGNAMVLDMELEQALLQMRINTVNNYVAEVTARKTELPS